MTAASELQARKWLRLDAAYCAGAGLLALALAGPLGRLFHVGSALVAAIGVAAIAWSLVLLRIAHRPSRHDPLRLVATANAAASLGVGVLAVVAPSAAARLLLAAVAVEVAAFALVQARTLRHP